jgi:hypothetical protein
LIGIKRVNEGHQEIVQIREINYKNNIRANGKQMESWKQTKHFSRIKTTLWKEKMKIINNLVLHLLKISNT